MARDYAEMQVQNIVREHVENLSPQEVVRVADIIKELNFDPKLEKMVMRELGKLFVDQILEMELVPTTRSSHHAVRFVKAEPR